MDALQSLQYRTANDETWDSSDAQRVVRVHVIHNNGGPAPLVRLEEDEDEEDEEDDDDDDDDDEETEKGSDKKYGDRTSSGKGNEAKGGESDDDENDNEEDESGASRFLFVQICPLRHNDESPLRLEISWVRINPPRCKNLKVNYSAKFE